MGQKGDKNTNEAQLSADLFHEKLGAIPGISSKKMFGGHGFFHEGQMFGMVDSKGRIALKADEMLEEEYLKLGCSKHGKMPYYTLPDSLFQSSELLDWVKKSIALTKG